MRRIDVALAIAAVALAGGAPAQGVYRCDDGRGGVLYADVPCRDGTKVDVQPGKADPAAIERLRRDEKAFAERHAAREAKAQAEAQVAREAREARMRAEWQAEAEKQAEYVGYPGYAWGGYWPWPPVPSRPPRPEPLPTRSGYLPAAPAKGALPALPVAPRR